MPLDLWVAAPIIEGMELTIEDVRAAREVVRRHLPPTPMWSYPVLDATAGATVWSSTRTSSRSAPSRSAAG